MVNKKFTLLDQKGGFDPKYFTCANYNCKREKKCSVMTFTYTSRNCFKKIFLIVSF